MAISRASMQKQLKGNRMPTYKTKKGNVKTVKPISKVGQKLLGMKNVKKKASGGKMKKKPVVKAKFGEFMGNISPIAGMITGKGMMGRALGKMGRNVSPFGRLLSDQMRKKKKGSASPAAATKTMDKKNPMGDPGQFAPATPMTMSRGGKVKIQKIPPALAFDLRKEKPVTAGPREGAMSPQGIRGPYKRTPFSKMNKGGSVKRKRPIDGIAQRGRTRAK